MTARFRARFETKTLLSTPYLIVVRTRARLGRVDDPGEAATLTPWTYGILTPLFSLSVTVSR